MDDMPKAEARTFLEVDYMAECFAFQEMMHSDLMKQVITSGKFPSVFRDPDYPDLIVVWDGGDSPHSPEPYLEHFEQVHRAVDGNTAWLHSDHTCLPPEIWEWVKKIAEDCLARPYEHHALFWFRGCEAAEWEDE